MHLNGGSSNLGHAEKMNGSAHAAAVPNAGPKNRGRRKIIRGVSLRTRFRPTNQPRCGIDFLARSPLCNRPTNATSWAHDGIITKNSLAAADAKLVEEAFAVRLSEFVTVLSLPRLSRSLESAANPSDAPRTSRACYPEN